MAKLIYFTTKIALYIRATELGHVLPRSVSKIKFSDAGVLLFFSNLIDLDTEREDGVSTATSAVLVHYEMLLAFCTVSFACRSWLLWSLAFQSASHSLRIMSLSV